MELLGSRSRISFRSRLSEGKLVFRSELVPMLPRKRDRPPMLLGMGLLPGPIISGEAPAGPPAMPFWPIRERNRSRLQGDGQHGAHRRKINEL